MACGTGNKDGVPGEYSMWSTNPWGPYGTKVWAIRNRDGSLMANTYLVAQDNIWDGCGRGGNCDYNDVIVLYLYQVL